VPALRSALGLGFSANGRTHLTYEVSIEG
jgi:hypothetical protein